jgi:GxxExxY protein
MNLDELTEEILAAAHEVHHGIGPGLHWAEYEACLCYELSERKLSFERNKPLPMHQKYKGQILDCGYALKLVVENAIAVELKYSETIESLDKSRFMILLKLARIKQGLLINFNVVDLQDGIVHLQNQQKE